MLPIRTIGAMVTLIGITIVIGGILTDTIPLIGVGGCITILSAVGTILSA